MPDRNGLKLGFLLHARQSDEAGTVYCLFRRRYLHGGRTEQVLHLLYRYLLTVKRGLYEG